MRAFIERVQAELRTTDLLILLSVVIISLALKLAEHWIETRKRRWKEKNGRDQ